MASPPAVQSGLLPSGWTDDPEELKIIGAYDLTRYLGLRSHHARILLAEPGPAPRYLLQSHGCYFVYTKGQETVSRSLFYIVKPYKYSQILQRIRATGRLSDMSLDPMPRYPKLRGTHWQNGSENAEAVIKPEDIPQGWSNDPSQLLHFEEGIPYEHGLLWPHPILIKHETNLEIDDDKDTTSKATTITLFTNNSQFYFAIDPPGDVRLIKSPSSLADILSTLKRKPFPKGFEREKVFALPDWGGPGAVGKDDTVPGYAEMDAVMRTTSTTRRFAFSRTRSAMRDSEILEEEDEDENAMEDMVRNTFGRAHRAMRASATLLEEDKEEEEEDVIIETGTTTAICTGSQPGDRNWTGKTTVICTGSRPRITNRTGTTTTTGTGSRPRDRTPNPAGSIIQWEAYQTNSPYHR